MSKGGAGSDDVRGEQNRRHHYEETRLFGGGHCECGLSTSGLGGSVGSCFVRFGGALGVEVADVRGCAVDEGVLVHVDGGLGGGGGGGGE